MDNKESLYKYVRDHYWSNYCYSTSTLSSTCRQLALGLGGLLWLPELTFINICHKKSILLLIVLFFIFDAAYYLFHGNSYKKLADSYDEEIEKGTIRYLSQLTEKPNTNTLANIFYSVKIITLLFASIFFLYFLFESKQINNNLSNPQINQHIAQYQKYYPSGSTH